MNQIHQHIVLFFILLGITVVSYGQPNILTFDTYMANVKNKNINYLVEKYNVDIANAKAEAAKVFPDPNLSLSGTDNQDHSLRMGYSLDAGLDYTLELGSKRKARMQLARSEAELSGALLEDYFRNLRADATLMYIAALKQMKLYEVQQMSYLQMVQLAYADSIRYRLGYIKEIDARQSKLEANTMLNDVFQSEMELKNSLVQISWMQGDNQLELLDSVSGTLAYLKRDFNLLSLITTAQNNRADLQAALKSKEVSQRNLRFAKANRAIDLGLNVGISHNAEVRNEIAPAPSFNAITAGINIPLKFSNVNKGEIRAAQLAVQQSEASYDAIEMHIQSEVIQAYNLYVAACRQVEQFDAGLLAEAKSVFDQKVYSYERGETSLLEVLNAQRTYNDTRENYYGALHNCVAALVELERASGIWDINGF